MACHRDPGSGKHEGVAGGGRHGYAKRVSTVARQRFAKQTVRGGLAALAEKVLEQDPFSGHLFVYRGRRGDLLKVIWFDGQGACLFSKRLEKGRFIWPSAASGKVSLSP